MNAVAEAQDVIPVPIVFTDSAAEKVAQLIDEEGNPDLKLRVFVQGGGCSGFQYGFTFDEIVNEDDTTMVKNGGPPRYRFRGCLPSACCSPVII
jgi:iron-sulfur cluster insertion protein